MNSPVVTDSAHDLTGCRDADHLGLVANGLLLSAMLRAIPLAAAVTDETFVILWSNTAFARLLGLPFEQIEGQAIGVLFGADAWMGPIEAAAPHPVAGAPIAAATAHPPTSHVLGPHRWRIAPLDLATPRPLYLFVADGTDAAAPPPAGAAASGPAAPCIDCRPLFDMAGMPAPFVALQTDPDGPAQCARQVERAIDEIRHDRRTGIVRDYLLSIPFTELDDAAGAIALRTACETAPEADRRQMMLILDDVPAQVDTGALRTAIATLRSLVPSVGLSLPSLDLPPELCADLGVSLLALPADRLTDWYRADRPRLMRLCRHLRGDGIRLLGSGVVAHADIEFARRLNFDFICYRGDPDELPESQLVGLLSVAGQAIHQPILPHAAIIAAAASGIIYVDATHPDQPIVEANPAFLALTGYQRDEVIGHNCRFLQGPDTDPHAVEVLRQATRRGEGARCEMLNYRKDGSTFWNQLVISPIRDPSGRVVAFAGMQIDATARREAESARQHVAQMLEDIAGTVPGFIYQLVKRSGGGWDFSYISGAAATVLGLPDGVALTPRSCLFAILPEDRGRVDRNWAQAAAAVMPVDFEFRVQRADGERRWLRSRANPIHRPDGEIVWNGVTLDVTTERAAQHELIYLRDHDLLTGLPNARRLQGDLDTRLRTPSVPGEHIALYLLDFVKFHEINDIYGASLGDLVLNMTAARLLEAFPVGSRFYRLQADQFAVVCTVTCEHATAGYIAQQAARILGAPFQTPHATISLQIRIGVCRDRPPCDADQPDAPNMALEFIQRADIALRAAKRSARSGICVYSSDIDDRMRTDVLVKQSIRHAIAARQFELHYQPLVALDSGQIVGLEALLRWNHPTLGQQLPDRFIPLAEETGAIVELGDWILREALRAMRHCAEMGLALPRVAVNVSGVQLSQDGFVAMVESALADAGVDPRMLELELTETYLIDHSAETAQALATLRQRGIRISIDDFGAGYSSFHYLRRLPVDKLKVDRSFVGTLTPDSAGDIAILQAMVAMAHRLGTELAVEGVETAVQRQLLADIGCRIGQGYFFGRPQPLAELIRTLRHPGCPRVVSPCPRTND